MLSCALSGGLRLPEGLFDLLRSGGYHEEVITVRLRTPAFDAVGPEESLPEYERALRRVYCTVFVPAGISPRYPTPKERVHICPAGVTSFFYRHLDQMHQGITMAVLRSVLLEPIRDLLYLFQEDANPDDSDEIAFRNIKIHLGSQTRSDVDYSRDSASI